VRVPVSGHDELATWATILMRCWPLSRNPGRRWWSSEARYRALFENANDAILLMRHDVFIDCNPRALVMFGCVPGQLIHQTPYADVSPAYPAGRAHSREKMFEKVYQALTGFSQRFEWRHTRYDGTPLTLRLR